jgi:phage-related protein
MFEKIVGGVTNLFNAAVEEESIMTLLSQGVEHLGNSAAMTVPQMVSLAEKLGQTTLFSHDLYLEAENLLMRFTAIGTETFPRVIQSAADLATVTGMDLPNAVRMLGRTLEDPITGMASLRRMNVVLTEAQKEQIKSLIAQGDAMGAQAVILDAIDKAYGGAAETMGGTFAGQQAILQNNMESLSELLGGAFLPLMTGLNTVLTTISTNPAIIAFFERLGENLTAFLQPFSAMMKTITDGVANGDDFFTTLVNSLYNLEGTIPFVDEIAQLFFDLRDYIEKLGSIFQSGGMAGLISFLTSGVLDRGIANLQSFFGGNWSSVIQATQGSLAKMVEYFQVVFQAISNFVQSQLVPFLVGQFEKITTWLNENKPLIQQFAVVINQMYQALLSGLEWLVPKLLGLWTVVAPLLNGIVDLVLNLAKVIMQVFTGDWAGAWEMAKTTVVSVGKAIWDAIVALLEWIAGLFGSSLKEIGAIWKGVWEAMKLTVTLVWNNIVTTITNTWNTITTFWSKAWSTFATFWTGAWNSVVTILTTAGGKLVTAGSTTINNLWTAIKGVWTTISTWWTTVWNAVVAIVTGVGARLYDAGKAIIQGLWNGMIDLWSNVLDWWNDSIADLLKKIKDILGIASPSQEFFDIGNHIMNGLISGISKNINVPINMLGGLGSNMVGAMGGMTTNSTSNSMAFHIQSTDPRGVVDELMQRFKMQGIKFLMDA